MIFIYIFYKRTHVSHEVSFSFTCSVILVVAFNFYLGYVA